MMRSTMMKMTIRPKNCDTNDENDNSLLSAELELLSHSIAVRGNHNEEREQNQKATHIWRRRIIWENLLTSISEDIKMSGKGWYVVSRIKMGGGLQTRLTHLVKNLLQLVFILCLQCTLQDTLSFGIGRDFAFGLKLMSLHLWFLFKHNFPAFEVKSSFVVQNETLPHFLLKNFCDFISCQAKDLKKQKNTF